MFITSNNSRLKVPNFLLWLKLFVAFFMLYGCKSLPTHSDNKTIKLADDLGAHHYPVSTSEPDAQRYFDQGLILTLVLTMPKLHVHSRRLTLSTRIVHFVIGVKRWC